MVVAGLLIAVVPLHAQTMSPTNPLSQQAQQQRAQQQAQTLLRQQAAPRVGVAARTVSAASWHDMSLPAEHPCFVLHRLRLTGPHAGAFGFVQRYLDRYIGRCVGEEGLRLIVARASDRLLAAGYVTSQVKLPAQNISTGTLRLELIAGTLQGFQLAPGSASLDWRSAFPLRPGDVLNLRALEQGLEQIKQVASQDVHMAIQPGATPGTSIVMLQVSRTRPWRVTASVDNEGFASTGRNQGNLSVAIDQPLRMNDTLTLGVGHSLPWSQSTDGSRTWNLDERIPWGWWSVDLHANRYGFYQNLTGGTQSFRSSGVAQGFGVRVSRVVHRTQDGRTTAQVDLDGREANNYIDGLEIAVQRRHTRSVTLGITQRQYLGAGQLDASVSYRHGVPWFGGQWDPRTANAQIPRFDYHMVLADVALQWPLVWRGQAFVASSAVHAQHSPDRLYAENYLAIGGPFTVRGYAGDEVIAADSGYYWRNQLGWRLPGSGLSVYAGWDYGRVWGPDFAYAHGHVLSGAFAGLQGPLLPRLSWDVSFGWPLIAPAWLARTQPVVKASLQLTM